MPRSRARPTIPRLDGADGNARLVTVVDDASDDLLSCGGGLWTVAGYTKSCEPPGADDTAGTTAVGATTGGETAGVGTTEGAAGGADGAGAVLGAVSAGLRIGEYVVGAISCATSPATGAPIEAAWAAPENAKHTTTPLHVRTTFPTSPIAAMIALRVMLAQEVEGAKIQHASFSVGARTNESCTMRVAQRSQGTNSEI